MLERLVKYLDQQGVEYTHTSHPIAYTAREVASAEHIAERDVAKTIVFLSDQGYGMAVLCADCLVDLEQLRTALGLTRLRLATEKELADLFADCELGAMPPLGPLFDMQVYVDEGIPRDHVIAFNAGTHRDVIRMSFSEFERLVRPRFLSFARRAAMAG